MPTKEFPDPPGSSPPYRRIPYLNPEENTGTLESIRRNWTCIGPWESGETAYITEAGNIVLLDAEGATVRIIPFDDP